MTERTHLLDLLIAWMVIFAFPLGMSITVSVFDQRLISIPPVYQQYLVGAAGLLAIAVAVILVTDGLPTEETEV